MNSSGEVAFRPLGAKYIATGDVADASCASLISQELRHSCADKPGTARDHDLTLPGRRFGH